MLKAIVLRYSASSSSASGILFTSNAALADASSAPPVSRTEPGCVTGALVSSSLSLGCASFSCWLSSLFSAHAIPSRKFLYNRQIAHLNLSLSLSASHSNRLILTHYTITFNFCSPHHRSYVIIAPCTLITAMSMWFCHRFHSGSGRLLALLFYPVYLLQLRLLFVPRSHISCILGENFSVFLEQNRLSQVPLAR